MRNDLVRIRREHIIKKNLDGILRHQFSKRLESFPPCYLQALLADLKPYSSLVLKSLQKIRETRKLESIHG
jgi:hypothetical protein